MDINLVVAREADDRWIAEAPDLPGVLVRGAAQTEAMAKAEVLALRVLVDRIEHPESTPVSIRIHLPNAA